MRHRNLFALPIALVAVLAVTAPALAGGWASVALTQPAGPVRAGEAATLEVLVLQHGRTPIDWARLTAVATGDDGTIVRADAVPIGGRLGYYSFAITLPRGGGWVLSYESPDLVMDGAGRLSLEPIALPAVPIVSNATQNAIAFASDPAPALVAGGLALILAAIVLVMRARRPRSVGLRS